MDNKKIFVTQPSMADRKLFQDYLDKIWSSRTLTNSGPLHKELEENLKTTLKVSNLSLHSNGTLGLANALNSLELSGEVITTPFSFVATAHAIVWNNLKPIFVDIDPDTLNLDPSKIESAITQHTSAILPVHVYGTPCDTESIKKIAKKHNLKIIYDAAHAFGLLKNKRSILEEGDVSVMSFHATKVFNTIEGGAAVCKDYSLHEKMTRNLNFGFENKEEITSLGLNFKMNELQAAFGLSLLSGIDGKIKSRKALSELYDQELDQVDGIKTVLKDSETSRNYSYYPIIVEENYPLSRNELCNELEKNNIFPRKYFYPLITQFDFYKSKFFTDPYETPIALNTSERILCLPLYSDLTKDDVQRICDILAACH